MINKIKFEIIHDNNIWSKLYLNDLHIGDFDKTQMTHPEAKILEQLEQETDLVIDYEFKYDCCGHKSGLNHKFVHEPIRHAEPDCPLCESLRSADKELGSKQEEINELVEKQEPFEEIIEKVKVYSLSDTIKINQIVRIWDLLTPETLDSLEKFSKADTK